MSLWPAFTLFFNALAYYKASLQPLYHHPKTDNIRIFFLYCQVKYNLSLLSQPSAQTVLQPDHTFQRAIIHDNQTGEILARCFGHDIQSLHR
jgi:hypothetical protein